MVVVKAARGIRIGEFAQVQVIAADDHDLHAVLASA
jgi:hypothetical protein